MDVYDFIKESIPLLERIRDDSVDIHKNETTKTHSLLNMTRNHLYTEEESLNARITVWWSLSYSNVLDYELYYFLDGNKLSFSLQITTKYITIRTNDTNQINEVKISLTEFEDLITNKELFVLTHGRINVPFIDLFDEYKHELLKDIKMIARRNDND